MVKIKDNTLFRLSSESAIILETMAAERHYSEAMFLEMLIFKEAIAMKVVGAAHRGAAFWRLINEIEGWSIPAQEDFTRKVFERIASEPTTLRLWEQAVVSLTGQPEDKRKQYVNQRLGRFCKRLIGWESAEEVQLGKGSIGLISSFTRLKSPAAADSRN